MQIMDYYWFLCHALEYLHFLSLRKLQNHSRISLEEFMSECLYDLIKSKFIMQGIVKNPIFQEERCLLHK